MSFPDRTAMESELSLQHLQAELTRIDVLLRREVRRWILANQDPADAFRGLYVSDAQAEALLARPIAANWGSSITLDSAERQAFDEAYAQAQRTTEKLVEAARQRDEMLRLQHLAAAFNLDPFDLDTLLICLAPTLDLRYEKIYGYLHDDLTRRRPSVSLTLDLLCEPGVDRLRACSHFGDDAPLLKHHLLERVSEPGLVKPPLLAQTLILDETVAAWLRGKYQPRTDFASFVTVSQPYADEADGMLLSEVWPLIQASLGQNPIFIFHGPDRVGQAAAARRLSEQSHRSTLTVNLAGAAEAEVPLYPLIDLALRDARLINAVPFLTGWEACLTDDKRVPSALLTRLLAHPDVVIVAGGEAWQPKGIERDRRAMPIEFPVPAYAQRRALWGRFTQQSITDETLSSLAGQFCLTAGQIRDAVAAAQDAAAQDGGRLNDRNLFAAARAQSSPRLISLARKIRPRYDWSDIILPDDQVAQLREIVATIRDRPVVLDEWGVGQKLAASNGVTILFAGPPGTGKTMAAEIIASELGLDLYKIDLSTIVSKYIGETEKNLEHIFSEAEDSNAILFFDEADALFGKRSEVRDSHDRYANIEISYLLQRMEAYDGVTILATNLRANLDEAFTRRLQFAVDFPFPEAPDRLRIWQTLFPPDVPRDPQLDFHSLAQRYALAGGSIRNIIVNAAYLAASDGRCVTMDHLLHGARREMQKMGRLIGDD